MSSVLGATEGFISFINFQSKKFKNCDGIGVGYRSESENVKWNLQCRFLNPEYDNILTILLFIVIRTKGRNNDITREDFEDLEFNISTKAKLST